MDFSEEYLTAIIETRNNVEHLNDRLTTYIETQNTNCEKCFEDHENRIRGLEMFSTKLAGGLAVVALGASWLFSKLTSGGG
jgi:hypothetical protein